MNVLFIGSDPSLFNEHSPARMRMRAYADAVASRGGILHIISRASQTTTIEEGPLKLYGVRGSRIGALLGSMRRAKRILRDEIIHVVSAQDPFEHGWIARVVTKGTAAKLHIQVHTDFLTPWFVRGHIARSPRVRMPALNRIRRHIAGRVLPYANGIRVVSKRIKNSLLDVYGGRIPVPTVIPIAVQDVPIEPVPLPEHPFTFALLAVGRLEPEKRIEDIIAAVARLRVGYPSLGAIIVGDGRERRKLERMAVRLNVKEKIVFTGARSDARGLMKSAQAFIQASAYEGYGLTLIEAALARVPIITTDVGIVGEVLEGYKHVLAAPVGDPTNLAAHIAWLIEDHEARKELSMSAEARAREHLAAIDSSPAAVVADLSSLLI